MTQAIVASVGFAAVGIILLSLSGILDRWLGGASAGLAIFVGWAFEFIAVVFGVVSGARIGTLTAGIAVVVLIWTVVMYVLYRRQRSKAAQMAQSQAPDGAGSSSGSCVPRLILGSYTYYSPDKETWRSHLYMIFECDPSNSGMEQDAHAWGGAYYGIYFTTGEAQATPNIDISCEETEDGCRANASEKGAIEDISSPVRVYIKNVIQSSGDTVTVTTQMGAALNASGGPSISVSAGPVSISMSFPDASLSKTYAMGTYKWRCERSEAVGESATGG